MLFDLILSLAGRYGGRRCRRCDEVSDRRDAFAMSEGVCRACGR